MAASVRCQIPLVVQTDSGGNPDNVQIPQSANTTVNITVTNRQTSTQAPVYGAETGGTPLTQPFSPDAKGRVNAWVAPGQYTIQVSGTSIATVTIGWDATSGYQTSPYTLSNVSANRTFDPTTSTIGQLAQALATLIQDLQYKGVVS